jgi:LAO/AO transport system kinase
MGDDVQAIKAGILEIADILVVNKADRPEARRTAKMLEMAMHLNSPNGWAVPVLQTSAVSGQGVEELAGALESHKNFLQNTGEWLQRERARSRREVEQLLTRRFLERLEMAIPASERERVLTAVAERDLDPYTAVETLLKRLKDEG